ncbi:MAG: EamA family transporter [Spirochaetia bacterium]|jgi:drug/metabolite transporter (DMT)-like permease
MKRQPGLVIASYATIYLVWGSTYFFIRQSVLTIPPMWVLAIRWLIGGGLLLGVSAARGGLKKLPSVRNILSAIVLGTLLLLAGNGGITIAELNVDSYVAALLASSTPILVALFDSLLLRKSLTAARVLGVVIGFAGVAVLLYNGHSLATSLNASVLIGLGGVLCWGLATSLGHRFPVSGDNTVNSGIQMLFVGIVSYLACAVIGPTPGAVLKAASVISLVGVLYLGVIGSLAFSAYTYLVAVEPAERVVSYALVNPLIALVLGLGFAAETPTPYLALGVPLALVGLAFMLYGERLAAWLRSKARAPD